jgi:hypothetical protein
MVTIMAVVAAVVAAVVMALVPRGIAVLSIARVITAVMAVISAPIGMDARRRTDQQRECYGCSRHRFHVLCSVRSVDTDL